MELFGLGAAPGKAVGPAIWYHPNVSRAIDDRRIQLSQLRQTVLSSLKTLREQAGSEVLRDVLDAQILIADDPELWHRIETLKASGESLVSAIEHAISEAALALANLDDDYLAARADDIRDVGQQILRTIPGAAEGPSVWPATQPAILVADYLYPSDTAHLDLSLVQGFLLREGSPTSHVAILARSLGIPAVILGDAVEKIADRTLLIMDGGTGAIVSNPTAISMTDLKKPDTPIILDKVVTRDGIVIYVEANIGAANEASLAIQKGADGIGLLRTEFLFDGSRAPSEDEHREALDTIAKAMQGRPVTVRAADIGGDKPLKYLTLPQESNPFLGTRAIRLLDRYPDLYDAQIRAAIHVGQSYPIKLMFPMVATLDDWHRCRAVVERIYADLPGSFQRIPIGMMIEVPSAALFAPELSREADFFSIGTNDLIQYLFAADRLSPGLAPYYQPRHPVVLRVLRDVIRSADQANIPVSLCGEMAGDPDNVPILLGLGLRRLSMGPANIPKVKALIQSLSITECEDTARMILHEARPG